MKPVNIKKNHLVWKLNKDIVAALLSDHLGNSKKWSYLKLVATRTLIAHYEKTNEITV